jgi:hypothetical protein
MTQQEIIDSHPSFRKECRCDTQSVSVQVTDSHGEPYTDAMCSVCIEQTNALGINVERAH